MECNSADEANDRDPCANEAEIPSKGCRSNLSTFCLFAQRVAWGEARADEIEFMSKVFALIDRMWDWDSGTNDVMS